MCDKYILEWLDTLITVTLDPNKNDVLSINGEQIRIALSKIAEEKEKQQLLIKTHVFGLTEERQIELFLKQYQNALTNLLDKALQNFKYFSANTSALKELANEIIICLNELLSFIEDRFSTYIALDERVPITYLTSIKQDLKKRLGKVNLILSEDKSGEKAIVLNTLHSFINTKDSSPATFRYLHYIRELLKELEALEHNEHNNRIYSPLDELLIYLNFNSKVYINYFSQHIADKVNKYETISEKMDCLFLHFKEFNQVHRKSGVALHPQQTDLKEELSNWFTQEIFYLEKKLHLSIVPLQGTTENQKQKIPVDTEKAKVLCILSTDQTGLILRAADELKILMARSMNEVFKTIVPHLSTPYKQNLSYDSMRSKSYAAEERDKEIAIQTLQHIIEKIREY